MRTVLRPSTTFAAAVLLWAIATAAVVAGASPQTSPPPQTPAAPQTAAVPQTATAPQTPAEKVNRFSLVDEEDDEEEPKESACLSDAPPMYCGEKGCVKCHATQAKAYFEGPHAREWNARTPAADASCERCHGPGKAHDEAPAVKGLIRNFTTATPREANDMCLSCHNREAHADWQGSVHDARNVACVNCHSIHHPKSERGHLKNASVTETCAQCHRDKAAKLQRAAHMPVREGKMECSTCHQPHGSQNVRLLRTGSTVTESCVSCHTEKRGPFLFEHQPVSESCTTCHDAHGSSNDRMLTARAPMLCQRCHIATRHPATPYDGVALAAGNIRLVNRGCVNCHSMIHGSNHASGVFFMR